MLEEAYDALPAGPHRQIETIPGIGNQTAAALVAKMVSIERFATPGSVVNYFGIFPEENTSGVDKFGRPVPPGTMCMSRKGNDLVRRCLWNAAKTAIIHNPVIRSLYARQRALGKRGDVALGHCMQKLLHLVFAIWKTDQPFLLPEPGPTTSRAAHPRKQKKPRAAKDNVPKGKRSPRHRPSYHLLRVPSNTPGAAPASPAFGRRLDFASCASRSRWNRCCVNCMGGIA